MIKTVFKISILTLVITLFSCNNENTKLDYKYADKPAILNCENINAKLINEAIYSFEEDLLLNYTKTNPNPARAYSLFLGSAVVNRVKFETVVSEHTYKVFKALQNEKDLWNLNGAKSNINYNSNTISCIADNIKSNNLKTTFNALKSTNFLSPELMGTPIKNSINVSHRDNALRAYIALDFYYSKLQNVDFSKIDFSKRDPAPAKPANTNVDFNTPLKTTTPATKAPVKDPHAGHNHN